MKLNCCHVVKQEKSIRKYFPVWKMVGKGCVCVCVYKMDIVLFEGHAISHSNMLIFLCLQC